MARPPRSATTRLDPVWTGPDLPVGNLDGRFDRLVHDYRSSIAESMFGFGPTIARRRSVCVRCHAGVRRAALSGPDLVRYGASAVCPRCAATLDRSRIAPVRR
jgi:hypothetical protein